MALRPTLATVTGSGRRYHVQRKHRAAEQLRLERLAATGKRRLWWLGQIRLKLDDPGCQQPALLPQSRDALAKLLLALWRAGRAELADLSRPRPVLLRALAVVVAASGCGVAGYVLFRLHLQLAARLTAGTALNPLQTLIANGSSLRTLWPGRLAAVFFLVAVVRLHRGPVEPAPGVRSPERLTPGHLRSGLRREYAVMRTLLVVVCLVAAVDAARAVSYLEGALDAHPVGGSTLIDTFAEVAGIVAAALVLAIWAWLFGADVRRLGAI